MPILSKLFRIWALGKAVSLSIPPINKLLSGLATIVTLVVIAAVLTGAFLIGGLYFAYHELVIHGTDPEVSMEIIGAVLIVLIVSLLAWANNCWKKIHLLSRTIGAPRASLSWRINQATNSFLDGLLGSDSREKY